jgi:hypothetical protein
MYSLSWLGKFTSERLLKFFNVAAENNVNLSIHCLEDFIQTLEHLQGLKVSCAEEIAHLLGFINAIQLENVWVYY